MKIINFPDGQPHVRVDSKPESISFSIKTPLDLLVLGQAINAYNNIGHSPIIHINWLMGARYDRHMVQGDSFDLQVIANIINSFNAKDIRILDPHSHKSIELIKNSTPIYNRDLYTSINEGDDVVLIIPDKGASVKSEIYSKHISGIKDVVFCDKVRDIEGDGSISIKVRNSELCEGKTCLIVDDICDGGGTFLGIASQINPKSISLCVTHGIFSKGLDVFSNFKNIYTTDSFTKLESNNQIKITKNNESTFIM